MDDDRSEPVTRLGPDSGGRMPGESPVRVYQWEWGSDNEHRPGLPWIGIFLLVFGGLLLLQQVFPQFAGVGSVIVLAIGLAFLVKWAIDRGTASLYAGSIITALAVPGLLNAAGIEANGLTTFSLGVAFLFIAVVRLATGGGVGWQIWFGGLLAVIGGAQIANAPLGGYLLPIILVGLGILLIARGTGNGQRW
ncbi:MAG: hypothetical protein ACJ77O_08230 [Chloroflexota bacterium]